MKKFGKRFVWLATAALAGVMAAGVAQAAVMPLKAPQPVMSDWTGFDIGVHGGYGWARPSISEFDLNHSNPPASWTLTRIFLSTRPASWCGTWHRSETRASATRKVLQGDITPPLTY